MGVNPRRPGRKKDAVISEIEKIMGKLETDFGITIDRGSQRLRRAEQTMRDNEERLRRRMETTTDRIMQRRKDINKKLEGFDFTVKSNVTTTNQYKQYMRAIKIKVALIGMLMCMFILFVLMMVIISNGHKNSTNNQQLSPPPIEQTTTTNKQL